MPLFKRPSIRELKAKRRVRGLIKVLRNGKYTTEQSRAAEALGEIGDARAVEPLIAALDDRDQHVASQAAKALGEIGDVRAVEPLIAALDGRQRVASQAAEALGKIGDTRAVEPLITILKNRFGPTEAAASALGKIGDERVVELLVAMLTGMEGSPLRQAIVQAIHNLGWRPGQDEIGAVYWIEREEFDRCTAIGSQAVKPLIAALEDSQWTVRQGAAKALGEIGDVRAVGPLVAALKDCTWGASGSITDVQKKPGPERLDKLIQEKTKDAQRYQTTLEGMGMTPAGLGRFMAMEQQRQESAAEYERWDRLQDEFNKQTTWRITLEALAQIGSPAVKPLIAVLKEGEPSARLCAVKALWKIGDARAIKPLIAAIRDSDEKVRTAVVKALIPINGKNGDKKVRTAVVEALSQSSNEQAIEALVENAVNMLVALYDASPKGGFVAYEAEAEPVKAIGRFLNELGGLDLMLRAHTLFAASRRQSARNLEMVWDHIGEWLG